MQVDDVNVTWQRWRQQMTQLGLTWQNDISNDVNKRVKACAVVWQRVKCVVELIETVSNAWGHVERLMVTGLAWLSRSFDDLHAYMICVLVRGQKQQIRRRQWSWWQRLSFCSEDSTLRPLTAAGQSGEALKRLTDRRSWSSRNYPQRQDYRKQKNIRAMALIPHLSSFGYDGFLKT